MKNLFAIFTLLINFSVFVQVNATSEDGKKVKLNKDGTWEYTEDIQNNETTSYVFVNGKKLISGGETVVHSDGDSYGDQRTSISIAKDGEKTLIIFWQETTDDKMNFFNWLWTGTVMLYLENGETISLIDRNIKGHNKITNGRFNSDESMSDLYQRFSAYFLTNAECSKLKESNLSQVAYKTTSSFEQGTTYLEITENIDTIKEQLLIIKR